MLGLGLLDAPQEPRWRDRAAHVDCVQRWAVGGVSRLLNAEQSQEGRDIGRVGNVSKQKRAIQLEMSRVQHVLP